MQAIFQNFLTTITIFSLLAALLQKILPGKSYLPYLKLFSGFLLILLFLTPILNLIGMSDQLEINIQKALFDAESEEVKSSLFEMEQSQMELYENAYEDAVSQTIQEWMEKKGYPVAEVKCTVKDSSLKTVTLTATEILSAEEKAAIKNYLQDFYQVKSANINIKVENEHGK
jgi:stage III sporulation protein AF